MPGRRRTQLTGRQLDFSRENFCRFLIKDSDFSKISNVGLSRTGRHRDDRTRRCHQGVVCGSVLLDPRYPTSACVTLGT